MMSLYRWFAPGLALALLPLTGCGSCCTPEVSQPQGVVTCCQPNAPGEKTADPVDVSPICLVNPVEPIPVAVKADGEESTVFRLPEDAASALLKLLPPRVSLAVIAERTLEPREKSGPSRIEKPNEPLTPAFAGVVRLPILLNRGVPAPRIALTENLVPVAPPTLPSVVVFVEPQKLKAERPDPASTLDLPRMGQPVPDRASLDDATRSMSIDAVLVAPIPERQSPAPFLRQSIPDPYENRRVVRVTQPIDEPGVPVVVPPRAPKP